jgi:hypothetical protein
MVLIEQIAEKREADFEKANKNYRLSKRDAEVLRLLCKGCTKRALQWNSLSLSILLKTILSRSWKRWVLNEGAKLWRS